MFKKPIRVKSNNRMKGSERKRLKQTVLTQFPGLEEDKLLTILPNKEDVFVTKIETQTGVYVTCYCLNSNPLFFEVDKEKILFPTVYTLWLLVDLLPYMVTWPHVFENISRGADLMLAGVVASYGGFENITKGQIMAVRLAGNRACVAIGTAALSSCDIADAGRKGKGIIIHHWYTDSMWSLGDSSEIPLMPDIIPHQQDGEELDIEAILSSIEDSERDTTPHKKECIDEKNEVSSTKPKPLDEIENLDIQEKLRLAENEELADKNETEVLANENQSEIAKEPLNPEEQMDQLLENCFFQALVDAKKAEFPMLASTFSAQFLHAACPEGQKIDIKKSRHKKMGKFFQEMEKEQLLKVAELSKGVLSIIEINLQNECLRKFRSSDFAKAKSLAKAEALAEKDAQESQEGINVIELFAVSGKTQKFFKLYGHGKGQVFTASEVRKVVTKYVKDNELVNQKNKKLVILDPLLSDSLQEKNEYNDSMTWDVILERFLGRMNPCHKVIINGKESSVRKGNIENVEVKVEQRMGNKKVTLVKNLELFGIDPNDFAHQIQLAAASSTTVSSLPGKNMTGIQVLIQGNQATHVGKLLDELAMPKKYVVGLDKLKAKSKKR